ncbi:hypothetical protein CHUAL_006449 [Chamberlinius hualienensis]
MASKLRFLLRLCCTVVCVSFLTLYFLLWKPVLVDDISSTYSPANSNSIDNQSVDLLRAKNLAQNYDEDVSQEEIKPDRIVLAIVVCGDRLKESLVVLKSAIALTTSTPLYIIIVTEERLMPQFREQFQSFPEDVKQRVEFSLRYLSFPQDGTADEWKNLFKLCACQRLFLSSFLRDVDSVLYVDTDTIFLRPADKIWQHFYKMNSSQIAAMSPEHEDYATGWYNRFAQHPYYKPLGVNSGVMLMNLTRMRAINWEAQLGPIYQQYKLKITWGDQDILNIYFHNHRDKLYVYPCEWNYRPDHCMYASICKSAEKNGVATLHGNRGVFHTNKHPAFRIIHETFQKYNLGENVRTGLLEPLKKHLRKTAHTNCGKVYPLFLKYLETVY